jgi:hypothetical protein
MIGVGWDGGVGLVNILDGGILNLSNIHSDPALLMLGRR